MMRDAVIVARGVHLLEEARTRIADMIAMIGDARENGTSPRIERGAGGLIESISIRSLDGAHATHASLATGNREARPCWHESSEMIRSDHSQEWKGIMLKTACAPGRQRGSDAEDPHSALAAHAGLLAQAIDTACADPATDPRIAATLIGAAIAHRLDTDVRMPGKLRTKALAGTNRLPSVRCLVDGETVLRPGSIMLELRDPFGGRMSHVEFPTTLPGILRLSITEATRNGIPLIGVSLDSLVIERDLDAIDAVETMRLLAAADQAMHAEAAA